MQLQQPQLQPANRSTKGQLWEYLSQTQKDLIDEGQYLMNEVIPDHAYRFKDYSFLIFPFAKSYEGFLKQLFKDVGFMSHLDYISDHLRLGKLLSPHLISKLGEKSLYEKIRINGSRELAETIWKTWKLGRNEIFHYFPHNVRAVTFDEANRTVGNILETMEFAYESLGKMKVMHKLKALSIN
ncbi:MAG: hypothetical protein NTZ55_02475 [Candidatus Roizmanbacteria bacterium]|nr:hypothetical protein [Candidatus Roizmanbacteria bacterium]